MAYDDIVIGSGLSALGVALGLPPRRRVLVLGGPARGTTTYYGADAQVPCAHLGHGGLGNYWHGVIPTGLHENFGGSSPEAFAGLFERFYPRTDILSRLGQPWLFVPWRPIRPLAQWQRLSAQRADRLVLVAAAASHFHVGTNSVAVYTADGVLEADRLWVAAGALQTPALLARSLGRNVARPFVSDHVICYIGQIDRHAARETPQPRVRWTREGVFFGALYDADATALYTLRPARFAFRTLDHAIELRAVFGLPTSGALVKLARHLSPGLLAEALYNRSGLFARSRISSLYAQVAVRDAYALAQAGASPAPRVEAIRSAINAARCAQPIDGVQLSHRPDVYIPAIHLHHSLDLAALEAADVNRPSSRVQVVGASALERIGCDHHTFKMMLSASERAASIE